MPKIALKPGSAPVNVEGFDKDTKRSGKGALHLMANTYRDVTPEELDWIKSSRPELHARLLIDDTADSAPEAAAPAAPAAGAPQAPAPAPAAPAKKT